MVKEAGGPLLLSNVSGNIEVDRAASTVEAHTGEGVIEVNQAGGEVIADTRGGSIQIGSARGVRCESGRRRGGPRARACAGSALGQAVRDPVRVGAEPRAPDVPDTLPSMAVPKQKQSHARTSKRRAQHKSQSEATGHQNHLHIHAFCRGKQSSAATCALASGDQFES